MPMRRLRSALAAGSRRWVGYRSFQRRVEPSLLRHPRVHRFARPPVVGAPALAAEQMVVCVVPDDPRSSPRAQSSLERQSVAPAEVIRAFPAEALSSTRAPWIMFLAEDDELAPIAIERLGQAVALAPDVALLTCDEDDRTRLGRANPRLRPGPSPELLAESDVAGGLLCVRRERVRHLPAGRAWRYELALRLAGADGGGHAHVPAILRHAGSARPQLTAELEAVRSVLAERDPAVKVEVRGARRRIRRRVAGEPSVDVVIPFRDRADLLARCAGSVLHFTTYENFRLLLMDNASDQPQTAELLARLRRDSRVRTMRDDRPFNFAALNNAAVQQSDAEFVLLLNNDTELISAGWIEELLEHAQRPDVGAVAPLLLYGDGTVQHVGAALGMHGYGGHPFAGLPVDRRTPFGAASDGTRNWLAVTAACMLVERRKFERVGGFDETFVVAGNDVDLCLRLTAAGHRSLCVPHVRLLHHEGRSRGPYIHPGDFARSERSYGDFRTVGDPFYNPNLTLATTDCGLRRPDEL
jgi:GT2 family glycosyltransferase